MTKALRPSGKDLSANDVSGAEDSARPGLKMSPAETAQYVAEFSAELSYLAREANLDLLAYLLDMARLEAIRAVQSGDKES
jgi:hypothetical protein